MSEVNCKINSSKSAKPQALAFINDLKKVLPIERSRMHLRITCKDEGQFESMHKWLASSYANQFEISAEKAKGDLYEVLITIEPALFREISNLVKGEKDLYEDVTVEIVS